MQGGLGNQLFQYAAARALALRTGSRLFLDLRHFQSGGLRTFRLDHFNIAADPLPDRYGSGFVEGLKWLVWSQSRTRYREKSLAFDPSVLRLSGNLDLAGYFQCETYFADAASAIRTELTPKAVTTPPLDPFQNLAQTQNAVSLHVRRGDYASNPKIRNVHGLLSLDYYRAAADYIAARVSNPLFFIFSDDPAWVSEHLKLPYPMHALSAGPERPEYEDLFRMARCRHHIIANSSFSWWGAWLNKCPDKIVIAPKRWFNDPTLVSDDIVPRNWVRLAGSPGPSDV